MKTKILTIIVIVILHLHNSVSTNGSEVTSQLNLAEKYVALMLNELKEVMVIGSKNPKKGSELLNNLLEKYYDSFQIAKYSAMPYWKKASSSDQKLFASIFQEYLIDLASNWFQGFNNVGYNIISSEKRGESFIIVEILLIDPGSKRNNTQLSLRIKVNSENKMKIIDVEIENVSMVLVQNDEFKSIIRRNKGDFRALIESLNKQINKNK